MPNATCFEAFTLPRLPYWFFVSAGASGISLAGLFQDRLTIIAVLLLSSTIIIASVAARLRDIGYSAWWTPLGIFPSVAIFIGIKAGSDR